MLALVLLAISAVVIGLLVERKREQNRYAAAVSQSPSANQPREAAPQPITPPAASQPKVELSDDEMKEDHLTKRIRFRPGSTEETVRGIADKGVEYVYLLRVRDAQTMTFRLSSYNNGVVVIVYTPNGGQSGPWNGYWRVQSTGGEYRLVVSNLGDEKTSYALEITIR